MSSFPKFENLNISPYKIWSKSPYETLLISLHEFYGNGAIVLVDNVFEYATNLSKFLFNLQVLNTKVYNFELIPEYENSQNLEKYN